MRLKRQIIIVLVGTLISMLVSAIALILTFEWQVISANQQATIEYLERDAVAIARSIETSGIDHVNTKAAKELLTESQSHYYVIDSSFKIVTSNADTDLTDQPIEQQLDMEGVDPSAVFTLTQGQVGNHSVMNNPFTAGYRKVFINGKPEYTVVVAMSRTETITATLLRMQVLGISSFVVYPTAFIAVLSIILGVLTTFIIQSVSKPINQIKDGLKYLDRNQFSLKVDPALLGRPNELGELARSAANLAHRFRDIQDTLEQKVEERTHSLTQAKARTEAILRSIGQGLVVTDDNRNIIFANDAAVRLTGFSQVELLAGQWPELVKPVNEQGLPIDFTDSIIKRALDTKMPVYAHSYSLTQKNGSIVPVSITASSVQAEGVESDGVIIVFRDITEERAIDQAKSEFVSLASHQLRTPLSSINWFSEMLLAGDAGEISEEQRSYLEEIDESSQRMVDLVNALLNVSRIELGTFIVNPELVSVIDLAKSVIKELEPDVFKKKIGLNEYYEPNLPEIKADIKLLRIVFQNLLSNAVKYTAEEGLIDVRVEIDKSDAHFFLITIKDNGFGIPLHQQEKIFTKLFRAENVVRRDTQGTGLGLYLVKSIVEYSQGSIWFESAENTGTTFFVRLPVTGMRSKQGSKELS